MKKETSAVLLNVIVLDTQLSLILLEYSVTKFC
jgi:hypothetical protein